MTEVIWKKEMNDNTKNEYIDHDGQIHADCKD